MDISVSGEGLVEGGGGGVGAEDGKHTGVRGGERQRGKGGEEKVRRQI